MATKSKLEQAVRNKAQELDPARRELALSQFSDYQSNKARIAEIEDFLKASGRAPSAERSALATERNQLMVANSEIAGRLSDLLEDKVRR